MQHYLYEPQYGNEQLRIIEEQEEEVAAAVAATAEEQDVPIVENEEPEPSQAGADW